MIEIDERKAKRKIDRAARARKKLDERSPNFSPFVARAIVALLGLFVLAMGVGVLPNVGNINSALRIILIVFTEVCGLVTIGNAFLLSDSTITKIARQLFDRF